MRQKFLKVIDFGWICIVFRRRIMKYFCLKLFTNWYYTSLPQLCLSPFLHYCDDLGIGDKDLIRLFFLFFLSILGQIWQCSGLTSTSVLRGSLLIGLGYSMGSWASNQVHYPLYYCSS